MAPVTRSKKSSAPAASSGKAEKEVEATEEKAPLPEPNAFQKLPGVGRLFGKSKGPKKPIVKRPRHVPVGHEGDNGQPFSIFYQGKYVMYSVLFGAAAQIGITYYLFERIYYIGYLFVNLEKKQFYAVAGLLAYVFLFYLSLFLWAHKHGGVKQTLIMYANGEL
mmetsp:Transcript_36248/g.43743  ORF Transcript_36248/g.43743 Transcript_36248/m.43743 type:complete len:164 (-) Transcript_36248:1116-1607(-)|eukprot:CAMPEP_0197864728 /NCGR_PEP_ID=MMETSP1438-20131217/43199_1 /TAXON_ID=1461541 /ORGANISM="Pterosperma sp., Strain CCMP1384" /LENGTH=163 /DNA_ID=CAMNT_0043483089 /DNA_START=95 /DNA_END=586 /DNA_ORIENTATION=-